MAGNSPIAKVFNCPSCAGQVSIRALGHTLTVACSSCGSMIDTSDEHYKIIGKANQKLKTKPLIPLGQKGKLRGVVWQVIGFLVRSDQSDTYNWREYLLFNPTQGFRWLTEFDGHWNYVITTKESPKSRNGSAHYLNKEYELFHKGSAFVKFVLGEFYWRVTIGNKVEVQDYILPPEILSRESDKKEVIWSVGEYIEPQDIATAFQVKEGMPYRSGVAPNQISSIAKLAQILPSTGSCLLPF